MGTISFTVQMRGLSCMKGALLIFIWRHSAIWECPGPTQAAYLGQNEFVSNHICLLESGGSCFSRSPGQGGHLLTSPTRPAALTDSHPCPFEPIAPYTDTQHGFGAWSRVVWVQRATRLQTRGQYQRAGTSPLSVCPRLLPRMGLTTGLPPAVYQSKAQWPQGPGHCEGYSSQCTHPLSQTEYHPKSWGGQRLKFNHPAHGLGEFLQ